MIIYSKKDFFSLKYITTKPDFISDILYVTKFNTDDESVNNIISSQTKIIKKNITDNYKQKRQNKNHKFRKNRYKKERKKLFSNSNSQVSKNFINLTNKLTPVKFDEMCSQFVDFFNKIDKNDISDICNVIYSRIIYEYTMSNMYVKLFMNIKNSVLQFNDLILHLNELCLNHFNDYIEKSKYIQKNDLNKEEIMIERKKFTGLCIFISHLHNNNLINNINDYMILLKNNSNDTTIEILCYILYLSVENKFNRNSYITHLEQCKKDTITRLIFEIDNILELKQENWNEQKRKMFCRRFFSESVEDIKVIDIENLLQDYFNNNLNIDIFTGLKDSQLIDFIYKGLDKVFDKKNDDIIQFSNFCKKRFSTNHIKSALDQINEIIDDLRYDIPTIDDKFKLFTLNALS